MIVNVLVPNYGMAADKIEIVEWYKKEGDTVARMSLSFRSSLPRSPLISQPRKPASSRPRMVSRGTVWSEEQRLPK